MKKLFIFFALSAAVMASGCQKYDDSYLLGRVDGLEERVASLEELCRQMNSDISSLQTLVTALQENDYVTAVIPVVRGSETIGYTITFTKSSPVTIYHGADGKDGQNGKDGYTPKIGVKQDTDGIYYWTLDGDWLTDDSGSKIKAEGRDGQNGADGKDGQNSSNGQNGADGKDGVTPQLKIEDDYWYVSYDNGQSWQKLGKATGEKGADGKDGQNGGDSIFKSVQETDTEVIFTLADSTEIRISKVAKSAALDIVFGNTDSINALPDNTYEITYTIIGADENTVIDVVAQDNYKAHVEADSWSSGKIVVKTPSADLEASRVIVLVSRDNTTIMRILNFVESVIIVSTNTVDIEAEGETVTVDVETNIKYAVDIPENDRSWISVAETRAATHKEQLSFTVSGNPNTTYRYSTVVLKDESGYVGQNILFAQKASGYKTVHVETAGTLESYIEEHEKNTLVGLKITGKLNTFDYDFMRSMPALRQVDLAQIDNTTIPASCFEKATVETVILPLNLTAIPERAFYQSKLTSIDIPASVESIGARAFYECKSIKGDLIIPDAVTTIGGYCFYSCTFNGTLTLGEGLKSIEEHTFYYCSSFTGSLTIPDHVTAINDYAFCGCSGFTGNLIISDSVKTIGADAFYNCTGFNGYLIIGSSVTSIGNSAFYSPYGIPFSKIYCKASTPPTCSNPFGSSYISIPLYVPTGCKSSYNKAPWHYFSIIGEVEF